MFRRPSAGRVWDEWLPAESATLTRSERLWLRLTFRCLLRAMPSTNARLVTLCSQAAGLLDGQPRQRRETPAAEAGISQTGTRGEHG